MTWVSFSHSRKLPALAAVIALIGAGLSSAAAQPAIAENNGVGQAPLMGWSSWSFIRSDPTAAKIEAQAKALVSSGLAGVGYDYINVDDFWYQCPGSQGPNVDSYGRWVTDTSKFPSSGSTNGIQVVASYVHSLGLKFGLYVTPGISDQAVAQNTPIMGTSDTADGIADGASENNYNCKGMQGINYSKPGAQAFINSWADEFASWGVDYVKLDGVGTGDVGDLQAWSQALQQTGRPIHLELSNSLDISNAATWAQYSNGWRTGSDIECYCASGSYPLTDWGNVQARFQQIAAWQPFGGPGGFNDYDSIEVGNGNNDGLTPAERQSQLSLWAMAASPLILGTDLTNLDPTDLSYLKNRAIIAVDQDGIDASRIVDETNPQVYAKTEANGDVIVGLFNFSGSSSQTVSVPLADVGISGSAQATDLWTGASLGALSGTYSVTLGAGATQMLKLVPPKPITTSDYEAEDATIGGGADIASCTACSGGQKTGYVGEGGTVTFNVSVPSSGTYLVDIAYCDGDNGRQADITVNGGSPDLVSFSNTGGWVTPEDQSVSLHLSAGSNTIEFSNASSYAPDLDKIIVSS